MTFWKAPSRPVTSTLDGAVSASDITITLTSVDGFNIPGIILIGRQDGKGNDTPYSQEYVGYTGITNRVLTGLTRGLGGTTAIAHNSSEIVELFWSVNHWDEMLDFIKVDHDSAGLSAPGNQVLSFNVTGVSGLSGLKGDVAFIDTISTTFAAISGASGYSDIFFNLAASAPSADFLPQFSVEGGIVDGPNQTPPLIVRKNATLRSVSAVVSGTPVSGATLVIDINKNYQSIFTDQNTRPMINMVGGTYVSTSSLANVSVAKGDVLTLDVDQCLIASKLSVLIETL